MDFHRATRLGLRFLLLAALLLSTGRLLAQGVEPQFWLDPANALPGAVVTATGAGFPADTPGEILWEDGTPLGGFLTDATGALTASVTVPSVAPGTYVVSAMAGSGESALRSDATLTVDAEQAPADLAPPTETPVPTEPPTYPIAGSSHSDNSPDAGVTYDGDTATAWITDPITPDEASFTLDLGQVLPIGSARWQLATSGTLSSLEVQLSQDGTTWGSLVTLDGWSMPIDTWIEQPIDVWARYVRFVAPNPDGLLQVGGISEIELWPAADARPLEAIITPAPEPPTPTPTEILPTDAASETLPTEQAVVTEAAMTAPTEPTSALPAPTGQGVIGGTGGQGAYCYAAADANSEMLVILPDGTQVDLLGESSDGWQQVACAGRPGWIGATFVQPLAAAPNGAPENEVNSGVVAPAPTEAAEASPSDVPATAAPSPGAAKPAGPSADTLEAAGAAAPAAVAPSGAMTFTPDADARVEQPRPTRNFGTAKTLTAGTFYQSVSYLRFTVSGLNGPAQQATLRLYVTNGTTNGPSVAPSTDTTWSETGITWNTRPAVGEAIGNAGSIPTKGWVEYDVTSLISGDGVVSLALIPDASDSLTVSARETGANAPQLVILPATSEPVAAETPPPPTAPPTQASTPSPTATPTTTSVPTPTSASTPVVASPQASPAASPAATAVVSGDGIKPTCTDSLQQQVDAVPAGGTLSVRTDCIYREQVTLSRPITLDGQGAAEIRGSDVVTEWSRGGAGWVSRVTVPTFDAHGTCGAGTGGCLWPEQVFRDGAPLQQVATGSSPGSGQFALTSSRNVLLGDDPTGATIEVTMRPRWISINGNDVVVQGFTMKHAAADAQTGGIAAQGAGNWIVRGNHLSEAHGATVSFLDAPGGQVSGNDLFNAGQIGVVGESDGVVISGNRIHDNNTEGFEPGWESGGIKIKTSNSVIVEGNEVYSNAGNGIWCDISCANATIRNNVVHDNLGIGIFFEISDGAEIAGNHVWENAWVGSIATRTWAYEAGILISSASNANVHDNVVAWNGDGIAVISQCRAYLASGTCDLGHPWNNVHGNTVHDNVIVVADDPRAPYNVFALAWLRDTTDGSGGPYTYMYSAQAGNSGSANRYWIPQPEGSTKVGFSWGDTHTSSLAAFNATPGEEGGSYISDAERDQILAGAGMPTAPASHASEQSGSTLAWANGSSVAWFQDDRTRIRQLGKHKRAGRS